MANKIVDFAHLHCHSEFSSLDGMPKVEEYIIRSSELGFPALALTEHGNLRSMIQLLSKSSGKFSYQGTKYDLAPIKPIFGCEFYMAGTDYRLKGMPDEIKIDLKKKFTDAEKYNEQIKLMEANVYRKRWHILLFAKNKKGLENILTLNYLSWKNGFYYRPRIDMNLIKKYSEGLVMTTSCVGGLVPNNFLNKKDAEAEKALLTFKKIFKDDLYAEIQPHNFPEQMTANLKMIDLADTYKVKVIATNDCHYLNKGDYIGHNALLAIQSNKPLQAQDAWRFADTGFYLRSKAEMMEAFQANHSKISKNTVKLSLENTMEIVDKCNVQINLSKKQGILPNVDIPDEFEDEKKYMTALCKKGWKWRNIRQRAKEYALHNNITLDDALKTYKDRMYHELKRIYKMKFEKYFLIVYDIIDYCRKNGIAVNSRGSASGSLVCYLLGFSLVDPVRYDLLFDRFLNIYRIDYPDIDLDIQDERRKEVFDYLFKKYGEKNVCMIGTIGRMKGKQALQDVGRVCGVSPHETSIVTKNIVTRSSGDARNSQTVEDSFKEFDVCKKYNIDHPEVLPLVKLLEGKARQVGIHAAGIQIASFPLYKYIPIEYRKDKDRIVAVSGIDWRDSQDMGLIKIDLLGLGTLSAIQYTLNEIEKRHGKRPDLEKINLEDQKVFDNFSKTLYAGIFQYDSIGMRKTCEELKFTCFEDVIMMNALYRPGCISGDTKIIRSIAFKKNGIGKYYYMTMEQYYNRFVNDNKFYDKDKGFVIVSVDLKTGMPIENKVIDAVYSGKKKTYSLMLKLFNNGCASNDNKHSVRNMKASAEHKIYTIDGWKQMQNIVPGDYVMIKYNYRIGNSRRKHFSEISKGIRKRNKNSEALARFYYRDKCFLCGYDKTTDVCHYNHDVKDNRIENFLILCPNHHREFDLNLLKLSRQDWKLLQRNNLLGNELNKPFIFVKVIDKKYSGYVKTYDITCESPNNNFVAGDIVVHNSMRSGQAQVFIDRKIGRQKIKKIHPVYDEITKTTYGIMVYQEQLMQVFMKVAGYMPGKADIVRKKVAKSTGTEDMWQERKDFMDGANKNNVPEKVANWLFKNMSFFGSYAFNKAHAAAYAMIGYMGMWLKTYYPTEYYFGLLKQEKDTKKMPTFIKEARKHFDINITMPDINLSDIRFSIVSNKEITVGFVDLKGVGDKAAKIIADCKPYKSLYEFSKKVNRTTVNKRVIEALINGGAFKRLYSNTAALIYETKISKLKRNGDTVEIIKKNYELMLEQTTEQKSELIYKQACKTVTPLTKEQEERLTARVSPLPPEKHESLYYRHLIQHFGKHNEFIKAKNINDMNQKGILIGKIADIKYNQVGDFHKEKPSEKEMKRIGWGKRYAAVNIEDSTGVVRLSCDYLTFPTFRHIIDKGIGTPVIVLAGAMKFGGQSQNGVASKNFLFAYYLIEADHFRKIMDSKLSLKLKYKKLNEYERVLIKHPVSFIKDRNVKMADMLKKRGGVFEMIVLITKTKLYWTKNNDHKMMFIDVEDETGMLSTVVWSNVLEKNEKILVPGNIIEVKFRRDDRGTTLWGNKSNSMKVTLVKKVYQLTS